MAVMFGLMAGCTLDPNSGDDPSDLSIIPGDIDVPCDANDDGVTDCVNPNVCRDAANTAVCACLDFVGTTCVLWDATCACAIAPACGDGNVDPGEACDDAGESATCNADCSLSACLDGVLNVTAGEACDDGAESATCNADCSAAVCGDSVLNVTAGEACDDGAESATCNADCSAAVCGDSVLNVTAGEACDDGAESATCNADCSLASCGDGITNSTAGEACDDVAESATCNADCTAASCGDGVLNVTAGEACDDGASNSDVLADACRTTCVVAACGDGVLDSLEGCDDGNLIDGDGCSALCVSEPDCPNGALDAGEDCDGGANCLVTCACPADYFPDGALGCSPCDTGVACDAAGTNSPYCANTQVCWVSALRVALPLGGTLRIRTGSGIDIPEVVPAGQTRTIGLMPYDGGATFWCTTSEMSVEVMVGSPNMPSVWLPGFTWPTAPSGPAALTNVPEFNVNAASPVATTWTLP
jgi:cysteine-rich repeat protein